MDAFVHFEIHATDPDAIAAFYTAVFGWQVTKWEGGAIEYRMVMTRPEGGPGINGGIVRRHGPAPAEGAPVMGAVGVMEVADADATGEKILAAGGTVALPLADVPQVGRLGYYKDPDGNVFGIITSTRKPA